jgi:hypothetical protein
MKPPESFAISEWKATTKNTAIARRPSRWGR